DEIWVEIIYSFAASAHRKVINSEHLLKSLTPLYLGRTASFVIQNWNSDAAEVEDRIERLCTVYEEKKSFLVEKWDND
ncbi:MAG: glycosyltransferase, partial [Thermodesulfovibrionales bacterium]